MQFIFKRNGLTDTTAAETLIEQKYTALSKYWTDTSVVLCEVEFEKVAPQKAGLIFRVEANLTVDGTLYRADAILDSFEQALDEVRNELDKVLRRNKAKRQTLFMKGNRMLKRLLRRG